MTVYKYLSLEILKYAGIVLLTVVGIYLTVDFFERIDNFIEAGLPAARTFVYLAYKIPFIITQILPLALLLSMVISFGIMSRNNEILALQSGGISIYALMKPVFAIAVFFTVFHFLFSEIIVPLSSEKSNRIWLEEVKKKSAAVSREKNVWLKDSRLITHIRYYSRREKAVQGLTLFYFDDAFRLARRVDARKGVYDEQKGWILYDLMEQVLDSQSGEYAVNFMAEKNENISFTPENLEIVVKKSEEMNFIELYQYVKKVESEGYDATLYKVDLQAKAAFPFICLILSVAGLGIAARGKVREGLAVSISYGLGMAFLYWIFHSFCISLGHGGMLPPWMAAWTANLVFSCFGIIVLMNAEH
ncbi:MAG: LPS export ABC transporter permease LptG [Desulfococcaceae bacterium]